MDSQKILEDFDTLWFFSNIFSSPSAPAFSTDDEKKTTQPILSDSPISKQQNPKFPIPPADDKKNTQPILSNSPKSKQENLKFPIIPKIQVEASDTEEQVPVITELVFSLNVVETDTMGAMETSESVKEEQRSKIDGRNYNVCSKGRGENQMKQKQLMGFTYFGFNFADIELDDEFVPMVHRFQGSRSQYLRAKMPPINDGTAMKEHLKSWAHAVACIVK